jgi:hypothetical protein
MIYYELSEKCYKEYERDFKKTHIGKHLYRARVIFSTITCFLWVITGVIAGNNIITNATLFECVLFFIGGLYFISSILWHIEYRKELKNYILVKNNK